MNTSLAQGLYFKAGGGYAIPMATQVIGEKTVQTQDYSNSQSKNDITTEAISGSFGAGTNFLVGGGFMFNENLGVELNVQFNQSKKYETGDVYTYKSDSYSGTDRTLTQNFSNSLYINPSFIITPGAGTKVPYGRFGVVVGSAKLKQEESSYYDLDGVSTSSRKWEYKGGVALGFQGAVGMNWMLSDKIDLFTEVNFISMTYYAEESIKTEDRYNDYDNLPDQTVSQKQTVYKKEVDPNRQQDPTKPTEVLREASAFSSLSLQVGIVFLLNGHGEN